ncbi:ATP-dependent helicase [bacterium endosymbiont of Escarpia laminata]|nr:MAG: ATP-dependent helicase [bacterium endosymbiont of Escarpia laminata]
MTQSELGVLPSGHLHWFPTGNDNDTGQKTGQTAIDTAFARGIADGLIALAAKDNAVGLSPALGYWRAFTCQYLAVRCQMEQADPAHLDSATALDEEQTASLLEGAPPMRGAEYLSAQVLTDIWSWLDDRVCMQIRQQGGLSAYLEKNAPRWHQAGRVCFHLAENKLDPDYPFAFMATYAPELTRQSQGKIRHQPLAKALQEYAGARNKRALIRLLSPVQRASESSALIRELVESGDLYHPLAWTPAETYEFLKETPLYEQCGVIVRLPNWWKKRTRPQVSVTIGNVKQKRLDANALLDFKLGIVLGDETLTKQELESLLAAQDGLMFIKGQWVEVDREKLADALAQWKNVEAEAGTDGLSFVEGMRLLAGATADLKQADAPADDQQWAFVQPGAWLESLLDELRSPETLKTINPGSTLKADLRPYQQAGVSWLWLLSQLGLGACLADDMGLGKTMQIIALLLVMKKRRNKTPSLLVLPASLLANWKAELERFGPSLRCLFVHTSLMSKQDIEALASDRGSSLAGIDLVLTTYGMLLRQPWLHEQRWKLLILDEAQAIKNPGSRQTRAAKKLRAGSRIVLTGTPIENRLGDLWSLFDFLSPGLLGSAARFKGFVKSLSTGESDQYAPLRNLVSPYILRRLKTDKTIITDLPEKTEVRAWCGLSKAQAILYGKEVKKLATSLETLDGMKRRGLVLASLMRFKQICNHPSQLLGDDRYNPGSSGKFTRLAELCEEIASRQEKMLVFTQFREITGPLAEFLTEQFGRPGLVLHGGTPVKRRKKLVDDFQQEDGPPFFILSLKAGGTGLNLTAASHVIHFDRWWNPAVENQATDRAFRIGQRNNVLVHKFVCQGTVEEKIDALIAEKTALASELLEGGAEALLTEMNNTELLKLVSLDLNKVQV